MDLQVIIICKINRNSSRRETEYEKCERINNYETRNQVILTNAVWKSDKTEWEERTSSCCKTFGWHLLRGERPIELGYSWFSAKNI